MATRNYWQTAFLQERIGLSLARVGEITWIPPLVYMGVALGLSTFSDRLVARGCRGVGGGGVRGGGAARERPAHLGGAVAE